MYSNRGTTLYLKLPYWKMNESSSSNINVTAETEMF